MKYLVALLLGIATGAALFAGLLYMNPFAIAPSISPLTVASDKLLELTYSPAPGQALAFVNDGQSRVPSYPPRIQSLWEPTIENTRVLVTALNNSRGMPVGVGVKFSTTAEEPGLLNAEVPVNSAWHLWLGGRGGLFIEQTENLYFYLRDIVVPARTGSGGAWSGSWFGILTSGPNSLATARVSGGSGTFAGVEGEAVESLNARAYSADSGPVTMDARLTILIGDE